MKKEEFETIPPLEQTDRPIRTIVLSTDENYAAPAGVMITSLLEVSSPSFFFDIVVLDNGITEKSRAQLQELAVGIEHAGIRFCDVEHMLSDAPVHGPYSKATYLSLFVPYLFRTHEKILFLDCDMIVRKDVSELFETEFTDEYIAATRDIGIPALARGNAPLRFKGHYTSWRRYATRHLKFKPSELEEVVNTGVILFNIPAFVADDFAALQDVERHIRFGYLLVDQCVINILFRGRVKYLDLRWNLQVQNWGPQRLITWFAEQYRRAEADPAIIHYITHYKPWLSLEVLYAKEFWRVARKTVWFHKLYMRRFSKSFLPWLNRSDRHLPVPSVSDTPLFSIIMPVHNRAGDLQRSLKSIRMQEFTGFEIIIIDDASTDRTVEEVQRLMREDPRIRLIRLETNGGPGPARNAGIKQARGKYIRICDSDDFYPPDALLVFARQIENQEFDLIAGNLVRWHSRLKEARAYPGPWLIDRDVQSTNLLELPELWSMLHFHRCAFRREFLIENGIEYRPLRRGEDPAYMADVLSRARTFSLIKDPVYLFHVRPREHHFSYNEINDEYTAHDLIIKTMTEAGFHEAAYCHSPFSMSHTHVTPEESLKLSERLIDTAKKIPAAALDHPYFQHPDLDAVGLRHDLLVVQNSTPEAVSELLRRGLLCASARERDKELRELKAELNAVQRWLGRIGLPLSRLKLIKKKISHFRSWFFRTRNKTRQNIVRLRNARWEKWRKQGGDLPPAD
jgi:lipopolysaccharide biosynthesis glycosyltransferase/glycosyltransferase involved in cell wall biosynthesis